MPENNLIRDILSKNNDCFYINDIYRTMQESNCPKGSVSRFTLLKIYLLFIISILFSGALLLFNLLFERKIDYAKQLALARVARTKYKIGRVYQDIQFIEDEIKNFDFTIYRIGSRLDRLMFLLKSYLKGCLKDFKRIREILNNEPLVVCTIKVLSVYVKRIPHTVVYQYAIEEIMQNYHLSTIYTGQMCDRFALVEEMLAHKYHKKLVCIPHGIENAEKMPVGYVGDIFYCSSNQIASKLRALYKTSKYVFDDDIVRKMYQIKATNHTEASKRKKVVFFTQPIYKESTQKIIKRIAQHLTAQKQKLYIKVHPLENSADYQTKSMEIINDLEEALIDNLCISLSSTVLLEALYNHADAVSIIHLVADELELKGRYEFLNDPRILKPKDITAILKIIDDFYARKQ